MVGVGAEGGGGGIENISGGEEDGITWRGRVGGDRGEKVEDACRYDELG